MGVGVRLRMGVWESVRVGVGVGVGVGVSVVRVAGGARNRHRWARSQLRLKMLQPWRRGCRRRYLRHAGHLCGGWRRSALARCIVRIGARR